jgi:hypothetical protein
MERPLWAIANLQRLQDKRGQKPLSSSLFGRRLVAFTHINNTPLEFQPLIEVVILLSLPILSFHSLVLRRDDDRKACLN